MLSTQQEESKNMDHQTPNFSSYSTYISSIVAVAVAAAVAVGVSGGSDRRSKMGCFAWAGDRYRTTNTQQQRRRKGTTIKLQKSI